VRTADLVIAWTNLIPCLFAAVVNLWAARIGWPDWSPLRSAIGALAAFYAIGYIALLAGLVDFVAWSRFYRGVSPVVWLIVWAGPVIESRRLWARWSRQVEDIDPEHAQRIRDRGRLVA
jgi:hypothetical protein